MPAALAARATPRPANPFDLNDAASYQRWRARKLAGYPASAEELTVDLADPRALSGPERAALLDRIARANMALYRSPIRDEDPEIPRRLGAQLGLHRLDANWLAGEDGISLIEVSAASAASDQRGGFIPYTDRAIRWHTDGYYQAAQRRIHGMILHCVRPAARGGVNGLLDPEMAYIALRDASPAHVQALMQADAMTIPARADEQGVARQAQSGPVFSVDVLSGKLHMRYTARSRSVQWKADAATAAAVACLQELLAGGAPWILHQRLDAGCGVVGHNVLHDRSSFEDDPAHPRLLYRARFLDRVLDHAEAPEEPPCRNG